MLLKLVAVVGKAGLTAFLPSVFAVSPLPMAYDLLCFTDPTTAIGDYLQ